MSTIPSAHMIYLTVDRVRNAVIAAGGRFDSVSLRLQDETQDGPPRYFWAAHIDAHIGTSDRENNEAVAAALIHTLPNVRLEREAGKIDLSGVTATGITFHLWCGDSVCERVLTGYRTVPAQPERQEPVYEVRCVDPLAVA